MDDYSDASVHQQLLGVIEAGDLLKLRWLISAGADVNQPSNDPDGETPLIRAIASDQLEIVRLLIESGADVNRRQAGGRSWTPLMYAHANAAATRILLKSGADVRACTPVREPDPADKRRNPHGRETALHLAAAGNNTEVVQLLIGAGAEVEALTEDGLGPVDLALAPGRPNEVASLLVQAGAKLSPERLEKMHATAHPADSHLWSFPWSPEPKYRANTAPRRKVPKAGEFRCPNCGAMLYSRRAKVCGQCKEPIPAELQLTDDDLRALREDRQWARDFADAFGRGRHPANAPAGPEQPHADLSPEDLLRRVSAAEQFRHRPRPEFWWYLAGYAVLAVVFASLAGPVLVNSAELVWAGLTVFGLLCWMGWCRASPICPNCKQNIKVCPAEYCHVCGKPLSTNACLRCATDSWLRLLFPFAQSGALRCIAHCPGCGAWLDTRIRRRRSR